MPLSRHPSAVSAHFAWAVVGLSALLSGCLTPGAGAYQPPIVAFGEPVELRPSREPLSCERNPCRWFGGHQVTLVGDEWRFESGGHVFALRTIRSRPAGVAAGSLQQTTVLDTRQPAPQAAVPSAAQKPADR